MALTARHIQAPHRTSDVHLHTTTITQILGIRHTTDHVIGTNYISKIREIITKVLSSERGYIC